MLSKFLDPKNEKWSEEELRTYEQTEKAEWDYQACLAQKFDEGERAALLRVAKNLLKKGLKSDYVQEMTGLSEQEMALLPVLDSLK